MSSRKKPSEPAYSSKTASRKKLKSYKSKVKPNEFIALKQLFKVFSDSTTYKFYDGINGKNPAIERLKSRKKARQRSFSLALKMILPSLSYIGSRRKVEELDRQAITALLTERVSPIKHRSSDSELRVNLTYQLIDHLYRLNKDKRKERDLKFYFLTFSCESWFCTYEKPEFDLHRAKEVVTALLRADGRCDAIGVFEIQALHKKASTDKKSEHTLVPHVHVIIWREKWKKREIAKFREKTEKRLKKNLLGSPLHVRRIGRKSNDMLRVGSYISKLPIYKKCWDETKGLIKSESPLSRKEYLRLYEILSYIPLKTLVFSVGEEAKQLKHGIWTDLTAWDRQNRRKKPKITLSLKEQEALWKRFWMQVKPECVASPAIRYRREG